MTDNSEVTPEQSLSEFLRPDLSAITQPIEIPENAAQALGGIGLGDLNPSKLSGAKGNSKTNDPEYEPNKKFLKHLRKQWGSTKNVFDPMKSDDPSFNVPSIEQVVSSEGLERLEEVYLNYKEAGLGPQFLIVPCGLKAESWKGLYDFTGVELDCDAPIGQWPLIFKEGKSNEPTKWMTCVVPSPGSHGAAGYDHKLSGKLNKLLKQANSAGIALSDLNENNAHMDAATLLTRCLVDSVNDRGIGRYSVWLEGSYRIIGNTSLYYPYAECSTDKVNIRQHSSDVTKDLTQQTLMPVIGSYL